MAAASASNLEVTDPTSDHAEPRTSLEASGELRIFVASRRSGAGSIPSPFID
jgi:hypothetical protein